MSENILPAGLRRPTRTFPWWTVDIVIAALYLLGAVSGALVSRASNNGWPVANAALVDAVTLIALGFTTASILIRRLLPGWAVVVCGLAMAILIVLGLGLQYDVLASAMGFFVLIVLQASLARRYPWKSAVASLVAIIAAAIGAVALSRQLSWTGVVASVSIGAFVLTVATAIGVILRFQSRFYKAEVAARDEADRREHEILVERVAVDARAEIAREMHDVIAHGLTVVISLADTSAALVGTDPARSRDTMTEAGEAGRRALAELRRMLGTVHDADSASLVPTPGWAEVPALVESFRAAGLSVHLIVSGDADRRAGDEGRESAIYRLIQESLTNVLRHARDVDVVSVTVEWQSTGTLVDVIDDGSAPSGLDEGGPGPGRGLRGMSERVALFGGTIEFGAGDGRGWRVHAWLPSEDAR